MPTFTELSETELARIREAINEGMPAGQHANFEASPMGGHIQVKVRPIEYPEAMFAFVEGLAKAEIALRDQGLPVRLSPDFRQRMLVVGFPQGRGAIAYRSTDGTEYADLAELLGVSETSLMPMGIEGYPYDSPSDFAAALKEAKFEHPNADFSRV